MKFLESQLASSERTAESTTRLVGTVTLEDGRAVHVVASAAKVCFERPPVASMRPVGGA